MAHDPSRCQLVSRDLSVTTTAHNGWSNCGRSSDHKWCPPSILTVRHWCACCSPKPDVLPKLRQVLEACPSFVVETDESNGLIQVASQPAMIAAAAVPHTMARVAVCVPVS